MISIVGTRLASAAALLLLLAFLYVVLPIDLFPMVVAVALILAIGIQVTAVWFFGQRATQPGAPFTLRIRVQDAVLLLTASIALGVLGTLLILRAFNAIPVIDRGVYLVGIAFGGLMLASPAANALVIWRPWREEPANPEPPIALEASVQENIALTKEAGVKVAELTEIVAAKDAE